MRNRAEEYSQVQIVEMEEMEDEDMSEASDKIVEMEEMEDEDMSKASDKSTSRRLNAGPVTKLQDVGIYTCNDLMMRTKTRKSVVGITTGSQALYELLRGWIETSAITDSSFGEFRSVKKKLAHTLSVSTQLPINSRGKGKMTYIDIEGTFRPDRIIPLAESERFGMDIGAAIDNRKSVVGITTGSQALDELLGGWIETSAVTDSSFGEFRSVKTKLAHTLSVSTQLPINSRGGKGKMAYVDIEGTFRPDRIIPVAESERFRMDIGAALDNRKSIVGITTGSQALDELLGGWIETSAITDSSFGEFRSVKRKLAHTLSVSTQLPINSRGGKGKMAYIDIEGTFRPNQIIPVAESERFGMDIGAALDNIIYARACTNEQQYNLLLGLAAQMAEEPLRLLQNLAQMLSRLLSISEEFNVAVYMTNKAMTDPRGGVFIPNPKSSADDRVLVHADIIKLMFKEAKGRHRAPNRSVVPNRSQGSSSATPSNFVPAARYHGAPSAPLPPPRPPPSSNPNPVDGVLKLPFAPQGFSIIRLQWGRSKNTGYNKFSVHGAHGVSDDSDDRLDWERQRKFFYCETGRNAFREGRNFNLVALKSDPIIKDLETYWPDVLNANKQTKFEKYYRLWKYEWETHGVYSNFSVLEYFTLTVGVAKQVLTAAGLDLGLCAGAQRPVEDVYSDLYSIFQLGMQIEGKLDHRNRLIIHEVFIWVDDKYKQVNCIRRFCGDIQSGADQICLPDWHVTLKT